MKTSRGFSYKYTRTSMVSKSVEEKKKTALEKGTPYKKNYEGKDVGITGYIMKFSDGYAYVLENNSKDLQLEEEIDFKLSNLRIEGLPDSTKVVLKVAPKGVEIVNLLKVPLTKVCSVGFNFQTKITKK